MNFCYRPFFPSSRLKNTRLPIFDDQVYFTSQHEVKAQKKLPLDVNTGEYELGEYFLMCHLYTIIGQRNNQAALE